jgi:hypothetical protein
MNDGPWKLHTGYLAEGLELFIRTVAYTKHDANVRWSNYTILCTKEEVSSAINPRM